MSRSIRRAGAASAYPAEVGTMPRPIRWNSGAFSSRSRDRSAWEIVGCATPTALAAALMLP
jgi:hypothetical protein